MKYIVISDLHLNVFPQWRYEWLLEFMRSFRAKANEEELGLILLGDVFEIKNPLKCEVLNPVLEFISYNWKEVYLLSGQHDSYKPGVSSLFGLKEFSNKLNSDIKIVDNGPCRISDNLYLLPYYRDDKEYIDQIALLPPNSVLMTHIPINEVLIPETPIKLDIFSKFKLTISGDIHTGNELMCPSTNSPFKYIGMVCERDFRDKGSKSRYLSYDTVTNSCEFIDSGGCIHMEYDSKKSYTLSNDRKYIIRISKSDQNKLDSGELNNLGHISDNIEFQIISDVNLDKTFEKSINLVNKESGLSTDDILEKFIGKIKGDYDKNKLVAMGREFYTSAK